MKFASPLKRAKLIRRYKRFLADVVLDDGTETTVHCPNPGAMLGLAHEGAEIWLSPITSKTAKLPYRWEIERRPDTLVGINTMNPNRIVATALKAGLIPELAGYSSVRPEVKYGSNSRIDFLLEDHVEDPRPCYVEVKNVHFWREGAADFPDSVTTRGRKHLLDLQDVVNHGARAIMLYVVQREDCDRLRFAADIDSDYAKTAGSTLRNGVGVLAYKCKVALDAIHLDNELPVELPRRSV
ncbi:MAG: DNA/RNA nuclease SfsA [Pseudomonadota bacterium]